MSTESPAAIEVAEEALQKLDDLKLVDEYNKDKEKERTPKRVRMSEQERRALWEEKQSKKPVLETGVMGTVKWYNIMSHYGFIARKDGKKDIFVHQTAIAKSPIIKYFLRTLSDNEKVLFDVVEGDKGPEAANVTGPDGGDVIGSKFYRRLLFSRQRRNRSTTDSRRKSESEKKEGEEGEKTEKKGGRRARHFRRTRTTSGAKTVKEEKGEKGEKQEKVEKDEKDKTHKTPEKPPKTPEKAKKSPITPIGTRRRVSSEDEEKTKVSPSKGAGDVALGAAAPRDATVH